MLNWERGTECWVRQLQLQCKRQQDERWGKNEESSRQKEVGSGRWAKGTANKQLQTGSKFRISLHTENQAKDAREFVGSRDALNRLQLQQTLNASSSDLRSLHVARCTLHVARWPDSCTASGIITQANGVIIGISRWEMRDPLAQHRQHRQQTTSAINFASEETKQTIALSPSTPFRQPPSSRVHCGCKLRAWCWCW